MKTSFVVLLFGGLLSLPLMAQENPKLEVFGGYQYSRIGAYFSPSFNGWNAAVTANLSKYLGVKADFGGAYGYLTQSRVSLSIYTYGGGPVLYVTKGSIKPFAHALVGGIHHTLSPGPGAPVVYSGYTVMAGGGVDVKANRTVGVRLVQADWLYYNFSNTTVRGFLFPGFSHGNNVRISTGIVLRF